LEIGVGARIYFKGNQDSILKINLQRVAMGMLISARSARSISSVLIYALVMASCHAGFIGADQEIAGLVPLLQPTDDSSESGNGNRKLMAAKQVWTPLWADEFDSWDSNRWSYQFGDGCQIGLCGWGNQELVSAVFTWMYSLYCHTRLSP
jgi:hypothetical protein